MADKDLKGVPLAPLTGIMDIRSAADAIPAGALRYRQNFQTVAQNKLRTGSGFAKLLSAQSYNNQDFHDQLLAITGAIRQPVTHVFEAESSRKVRSMFVATQSTIAQLDQYSGNYRILGSGFGGEPNTSAETRRFQSAQIGDYIVFTNGFDAPMWHFIESNPTLVNDKPLQIFSDFGPTILNVSRASVVWAWKNVLFFADIDVDGERQANLIMWSDYSKPISFDPAVLSSIAGQKFLDANEVILAGKPFGNTFLVYTNRGIWEISVVGGTASFAFRKVYDGEVNDGVATLKYPNTLVNCAEGHRYMAEDGIYFFNQFQGPPKREEWLHRGSWAIYENIDKSACNAHVGYSCDNELLFSVARVGAANQCPDITLRINLTYKVCDIVDHGFTCFTSFRTYPVPTIRDFMIENGICDLATLTANGYGYTNEGLPNPLLSNLAPFTPQVVYTSHALSYPGGTTVGPAKTPTFVSRTSNVATITIPAHGLSNGNVVQINGIADPSFNATAATVTVVDSNNVSYPNTGPNVSTESVNNPRVRKLGVPRIGIAQFVQGSTPLAQVFLSAHGFSAGQKIRLSPVPQGTPGLKASEGVVVASLDSNNFTYNAEGSDGTVSLYPKSNITNIVPPGAVFGFDTKGDLIYTLPVALVTGEYYVWQAGVNDANLTFNNVPVTAGVVTQYTGGVVEITGYPVYDSQIQYTYSITTTAPPATGGIRFNNTSLNAVSHIYVSREDTNGEEHSPGLNRIAVGDTLMAEVFTSGGGGPFPTGWYLVTSITQFNGYIDFTVTHQFDNGFALVDAKPCTLSVIKTSNPSTLVTASLFTGIPVSISTIGSTMVPTTVERDDPDNPTVVTMGLTAHGLLPNDIVAIDGISDTSFNAYSTPVVLIQNTTDPTFSVTDANHFTYIRPGNSSPQKPVSQPTVSLLTSGNVSVEDWTQPAPDSDSLCVLLGNQTLDDTCRQCDGQTLFVAASSQDWCMKQLGGVFYREICTNPTAVGSTTTYGYASAIGTYQQQGYDKILRFALAYTQAQGKPNVRMEELKLNYESPQQNPAPVMGLRVGLASQVVDPNDPNAAGLLWFQHSQKAITAQSTMTSQQYQQKNVAPSKYTHWNFLREARYLATELKMSGVGGDAIFTGVEADIKVVEAGY